MDDEVPEERRVYQLTLTAATPGLDVSPSASRATVTMAASDHPHGRFTLAQPRVHVTEEAGPVRRFCFCRLPGYDLL